MFLLCIDFSSDFHFTYFYDETPLLTNLKYLKESLQCDYNNYSISNQPIFPTSQYVQPANISNQPISPTSQYFQPANMSNQPICPTSQYLQPANISNQPIFPTSQYDTMLYMWEY